MNERPDRERWQVHLAAFADGELGVTESLHVLERLTMDPYHTHRVVHQQQLRQAVNRAMRDPEQAPASLRQQIAAMAASAGDETDDDAGNAATNEASAQPAHRGAEPSPTSPRRGWRAAFESRRRRLWMPLAAAATVGLAALVGLVLSDGFNGHGTALLTPATIQQFSKRHVQCSHGLAQLHNATRYPTEVGELPAALADRLERKPLSATQLNLQPLGYRFDRAGDCRIPGDQGVHVVYRAARGTERSDAISLWIHPASGELELEPGKLYEANSPNAPHPILMWRHAGLAYYLVGDSATRVEDAAQHLLAQASLGR